jgi:hypothetical protein
VVIPIAPPRGPRLCGPETGEKGLPHSRLNAFGIWAQGAAAIVVGLFWVAGGGSTGTTTAALKSLSACNLVSVDDAKELLGATVTVAQDSDTEISGGQRVAKCTYTVPGQEHAKTMDVGVTRPVTKAKFETDRRQIETIGKAKNVAGLGDAAYSFESPKMNSGGVRFLKGQYTIDIIVLLKGVDPSQIVARIIPIARQAAGRPL